MNRAHTVLDHNNASSMIIYDLNIKNISGYPGETHSPLFIDTNAKLPCTVPLQCLQAVARWRTKKIKRRRSIQLNQLALSHTTDGPPAAMAVALEQGLWFVIATTL